MEYTQEASYYTCIENQKVQCALCPHYCKINPGQSGKCQVRKNIGGKLFTMIYGHIVASNLDPIEKKPLYHFFPGKQIFSIGTQGCNFRCNFCQNWHISQNPPESPETCKIIEPAELFASVLRMKKENIGIAYTYNEPGIGFEYVKDLSVMAHNANLKNVWVSNGFIAPEPLMDIMDYTDAFNIDLKAFDESFYQKVTGGKLEPVKETLIRIVRSKKHLEITLLLIPTLNDDETKFTEMIQWISQTLGDAIPLHISRYFPHYQSTIASTSGKLMDRFYEIAVQKLKFVYLGNDNSNSGKNTKCPSCGNLCITRDGYQINTRGIDFQGACNQCHEPIALKK